MRVIQNIYITENGDLGLSLSFGFQRLQKVPDGAGLLTIRVGGYEWLAIGTKALML